MTVGETPFDRDDLEELEELEMIAEKGLTKTPELERVERPDILTYTGHYFSFVEPELSEFTILDIAHALSNLCRFGGHTRRFYSVAEHSVLVSRLVPPAHRMAGLLHDAAEGLGMVDVPRPLKQYMRRLAAMRDGVAFTGDLAIGPERSTDPYGFIEARVDRAVFVHFGLDYPPDPLVKLADRIALYIEQQALMPSHTDKWAVLEGIDEKLYRRYVNDLSVSTLQPLDARQDFIHRFYEIQNGDTTDNV